MKTIGKLLAILLVVALLAPTCVVGAEDSRAEEIAAMLNESEELAAYNGSAFYEDGVLEIVYSVPDSELTQISFPFDGSVIECVETEEIDNYDDAVIATSRAMYAFRLLLSVLNMNGFTNEQISAFFGSENSDPSFEKNGFEFEESGEDKVYTSDDGTSTITYSPFSIRIDVSRANLNPEGEEFTPTDTTVQSLVDHLSEEEDFTSVTWDDGTVASENTIAVEDGEIVIEHTDYTYDYYEISFDCVDDVLTYEAPEITDYDQANSVIGHEMWALTILQYALTANGYSHEEIVDFFSSDNAPTFEDNGIEFTESDETVTFEGDDGDVTVAPIFIKIDLKRANINAAAPADGEQPQDNGTKKSPQTGDAFTLVALVFVAAVTVLCAALFKGRKTEE